MRDLLYVGRRSKCLAGYTAIEDLKIIMPPGSPAQGGDIGLLNRDNLAVAGLICAKPIEATVCKWPRNSTLIRLLDMQAVEAACLLKKHRLARVAALKKNRLFKRDYGRGRARD